jgi:hypothetical protein
MGICDGGELAEYGVDEVLKEFPFGRGEVGSKVLVIPAIDLKDGRCVRLRQAIWLPRPSILTM